MDALFAFGGPVSAGAADIVRSLGRLAPWELAQDWDRVGLQVGSGDREVTTVLVGLDPDEALARQGVDQGAQLLVTHHPLIFRPLERIDPSEPTGAVLELLLANGMGLVAAHTNLDAAPGGLADRLARELGLADVRGLVGVAGGRLKLVTYVPPEAVERVTAALEESGAGTVGAYAGCMFLSAGTGRFRPLAAAKPYRGKPGSEERTEEIRLETVVDHGGEARAVEALRRAHPYEEPVIDLLALEGGNGGALGRVGELECAPGELAATVKRVLGCRHLRTAGEPPGLVKRVAVVPGSGGDFVGPALSAGAQVLVTGEIRYHQALEARARSLWVIEAGHDASERLAVPLMAGHLRRSSGEEGWGLNVLESEERNELFEVC